MNKLNFHEFYEYVWEDEMIEIIVSTKYMDENEEFIRHLTFDIYRLYEFQDIKPVFFKKMLEIWFNSLFLFQPDTHNIKEIQDNYKDF